MNIRDEALLYAAKGLPVLPLYPIVTDDETGERVCACRHDDCGRSAGKHPLSSFAPHGVNDATVDPEIINGWPSHINIGLALTDTFLVIDIDDQMIAQAILTYPEIEKHARIAVTGKGIHLYIQAAPTPNGVIKLADGRKVADVQAAGRYTVLPPSEHAIGQYRWHAETLLEHGPHIYQSDGYAYAREILALVGHEMGDRKTIDVAVVPASGPIDAIELPFTPREDHVLLRQLLSGTYPTDDRSDALYRLACESYRVAWALAIDLDPQTMAGVVKHTDAIAYKKFIGRTDCDVRIWELVARARADVDQELAGKAQPAQPQGPIGGTYTWDESNQEFVDNSGRSPKRISNFEATITGDLEMWDGDGPSRRTWQVELRKTGERHTLLLEPKQLVTRNFEQAIRNGNEGRGLPPSFIVEDGMWGKLLTGMQHYSKGKWSSRRAYATSGWLPDADAFLLPSSPGAITADGFNPSIVFESESTPSRFLQYGIRVAPRECDLIEVFRALLTLSTPQVVVPLLTQVLAAPMASLGSATSPSVVHLHARTGSFKSTISRIMLSLYGRFTDPHTDHVEEWKGTVNSLAATLYRARDLPVLIDDFKLVRFHRRDLGEIVGLIQNYADRTARTRMGRDQREQQHLVPRCLVVSTGEDVWEDQESAAARTLLIDATVPELRDDAERRKMESRLSAAQAMAIDGRLGALGFAWLSWLAGRTKVGLSDALETYTREMREKALHTELGSQHPRVAASVASLLATDKLVREFISDKMPSFAGEYADIVASGWRTTIASATETAKRAAQSSPYEVLHTAIIEGLATGTAYLQQRLADGLPYGSQGSDVVGFIDHEKVYLSKGVTLGWYRKMCRLQGIEPVVGWESFVQEAEREHGLKRQTSPIRVYGSASPLRLAHIDRAEFLGENATSGDPLTQPQFDMGGIQEG